MSKPPRHRMSRFDATVEALRAHLLDRDNRFERGPAYEGHGKVLASVKQAASLYQGLGYSKLLELGDPPFYALMQRGRQEVHLLWPHDAQIQQWLADRLARLNDPIIRADRRMRKPNEHPIPIGGHPLRFHVNEVDGVFIASRYRRPCLNRPARGKERAASITPSGKSAHRFR